MSESSTRSGPKKGVGPARRPSTRRISASGLRRLGLTLKPVAIWGKSTRMSVVRERYRREPGRCATWGNDVALAHLGPVNQFM